MQKDANMTRYLSQMSDNEFSSLHAAYEARELDEYLDQPDPMQPYWDAQEDFRRIKSPRGRAKVRRGNKASTRRRMENRAWRLAQVRYDLNAQAVY